jgi:predicted HTH transcriptional regulator
MDDMDADGGILVQYEAMMSFLKRNLRNVQVEPGFNTLGRLEIPIEALSEICSNALLHRSYSLEAPIRLFVFDNRVEIHSPGVLPGGLQVEDVMTGTSLPRNKTLFTHGAYLLPYSRVGSGFLRVREFDDKVEVVNDTKKKEVIVTFWRESNQESVRPSVRVTEKSDRDNEKSVRPGDRPDVRAKAVLTGKELDIVNYCTVPRTSKEILARVGVSYHSKNLAKYVKSLVSKGFLKMTIPDKPNDPNQKYVKV